jgi:GT2 family glycosyltransferase
MLILQEIQFPAIGDLHNDMYMRGDFKKCRLDSGEKLLFAPQGETVTFDTYFNSFSYEKWRKYTVLESVSLQLRLRGTFEVALVQWVLGDEPERFVLYGERIHADASTTEVFTFEPLYERGILAFELKALSEDAAFCGGAYITDEIDLPPVNIAVCICTFRREAFIKRTIAELGSLQDGVLKDHWRCYIADNGRTLDVKALSNERVQILPNMNGGGSAGFARAMLAALDDREKHGLTHCLLMDDDVVFTHYAIERMGVFLRLLKSEYRGAMFSGAMHLLGKSNIQWNVGDRVDINSITPFKSGYCLSSLTDVLKNEIEESIDYFAWFFCCFPLDDDGRKNLPLPLFFQYDDTEFGLRNHKRQKITLNGVCVWHEAFDKKRSIAKDCYYGVRNRLIMVALHPEAFFGAFSKKWLKKFLLIKTASHLLTYRYKAAELVIRAGEDFLRGIDWLVSVNPEALNREVVDAAEPLSDIETLPASFDSCRESLQTVPQESKFRRLLRFCLFNGVFSPARRKLILSEQDARSRYFFFARQAVIFNTWTRKGYVVEKNLWRMFKVLGRLLRLFRTIDKSFIPVVKQYRERFPTVVSEDFWRTRRGV